jgi:Lrp/AsnC family transcriptional regulator for asnA, asnC and gidA
MVRISNFDILELMKRNARITYSEIARKLGVSETAIRKRVRKMETEGIISGYSIDVNPRKTGILVALIGVDTTPDDYLAVLERLKRMKNVEKLYSSRGDHMIMMECWFRDRNSLNEFNRKLKKIKGVKKVCPAILSEKLK